ncbi:uncharacterized protein LOC104265560 [Ciona intestinalis]
MSLNTGLQEAKCIERAPKATSSFIETEKFTDIYERVREKLPPSKVTTIKDLKDDTVGSFVSMIHELEKPVLLILEDIPCEPPQVFRDLLLSFKFITPREWFHIYIATRNQTVLPADEAKSILSYTEFQMQGFSENEGLDYLFDGSRQKAAKQVFRRFSGSILGLQTARGFCRKARISYKRYIGMLKDDEKNLHELEKGLKAENQEYDESASHIFQAITLPFRTDRPQQLEVMSCLSYLHHHSIPRTILTKIFQHLDMEMEGNWTIKSGTLISDLIELNLCIEEKEEGEEEEGEEEQEEEEEEEGEGEEKFITLHEVVLHAFRVITTHEENSLKIMISVLAGAVTKDTRDPKMITVMKGYAPHVRKLLDHAKEAKYIKDDIMAELQLSNLYEAYGATEYNFEYMSKAYELVMKQLGNEKKLQPFICQNKSRKNISDCSNELLRIVQTMPLSVEIIQKYESEVMLVQDKDWDFMEQQVEDNVPELFQGAREIFNKCGKMNQEIFQMLRSCKVIPTEEQHQKVFYVQRLASIFHNASRVILYSKPNPGEEKNRLKDALWLSRLSSNLSIRCREHFGVGLIFEDIAAHAGAIHIQLSLCHYPEGSGAKKSLLDMQRTCDEALAKQFPDRSCCPNWLIINETESELYRKLSIKRYLVRIHTRLVKDDPSHYRNVEADCTDLHQLALQHLKEWEMANKCLIYVGKLYASGKRNAQGIRML